MRFASVGRSCWGMIRLADPTRGVCAAHAASGDRVKPVRARPQHLDELRSVIYCLGSERARELETTFWLIVKARLLRQALSSTLQSTKWKGRRLAAQNIGGRALRGARSALDALESMAV